MEVVVVAASGNYTIWQYCVMFQVIAISGRPTLDRQRVELCSASPNVQYAPVEDDAEIQFSATVSNTAQKKGPRSELMTNTTESDGKIGIVILPSRSDIWVRARSSF